MKRTWHIVLPLGFMLVLGLVPTKDPISAVVMTELADLFSLYLFSTSGGNEELLKFTSGVYGEPVEKVQFQFQ